MGTRSKSDAWDDIGHGNEPPAPHKAGRKKSLDLPDHLYLDGDGKKRHKDMCGPGTVGRGCGFFFDPSKYNRAALLCSECANKMGADLDIPYEFIPHAITVEGNLGYFREKVPVLETFPLRQQIRMVLGAAGIAIRNATAQEKDGVDELRGACRNLRSAGHIMDRVREVAAANTV